MQRYAKSNWNYSINFQTTILRYPAPWGGEVHSNAKKVFF
jgi:hypothetical protein